MLLVCAAPDPAALEGDAKATIQTIRTFTHHAISVFFERFRSLVRDTNGGADEEDINEAWRDMNWFIFRLRKRQYQDEEFLPELVDGLAALVEQDIQGIKRLRTFWHDHREWFKERKHELDERRKVCCMALSHTSHDCRC